MDPKPTSNYITDILAETDIKPKNLLVDGLETYLLKYAVEGQSIPFLAKIAALVFIPIDQYNSLSVVSSRRDYNVGLVRAWSGLMQDDPTAAREHLLSIQKGQEIMQEMAKAELADPRSRLRIILWLVLIAAVVIGIPLLLSMRR